jgi:hypothetical protein
MTPARASVIPCRKISERMPVRAGAERHADCNFGGALRDQKRHHPVNADGGENHRKAGETAQHGHGEALARHGILDTLLHRCDVVHRTFGLMAFTR